MTRSGFTKTLALLAIVPGCIWAALPNETILPTPDPAQGYSQLFGYSVAIDVDWMVVGAPLDGNPIFPGAAIGGQAFVYQKQNGIWTQVGGALQPPTPTADNFFGHSVAISGNTIVVGAWGENSNTGAAYVFQCSASGCGPGTRLTALGGVPNDFFGYSVAVSGSTVAVVALSNVAPISSHRAVYVFDAPTWTQSKLTSPAQTPFARLGRAVAIRGNMLVAGAYGEGNVCAYAFTRTGGVWTVESSLPIAVTSFSSGCGYDLALSGDAVNGFTAVVGSTDEPGDNGEGQAGAAYVFSRSPFSTFWNLQARLKPSVPQETGFFGDRVAVSGTTVAVGASGLAANRGSLDIFTRDPVTGSWTRRTATLGAADFSEPPTSGPGANGFPVAISGNTIVTTPARVHIFDVPAPPPPVSVTITTTPPGHSVSITGTGCQAGTYNQTQTLNLLPGTLCTLSIPAQTLTFLGWENSTKNATRPIEIPFAPYTYVAHFGAKFGISVSPAGAGTVSGPTIQTCTGSCIVPVDAAPSNTLTAAAGGLYTFAGWGGDCSSFGTNPSCTLPSDSGDKFIIANFTTPPTTLTAAVGLKSGIVNGLRTWPIVFTNKGPGPALDIYVLSFAVDQAVPLGTLPTCFPKMVTGPNVPPGTSIVPAGGTLVFPATIDFTGCKSTDRFHLLMYYGWGNIPIAQKLELWNQLQ